MCRGRDDAAECLLRKRTEIVHGETVYRELLLEVDEGDPRFWNDVEFLSVDLRTCESESEKKKSRSAALIDRERCYTKWKHTRSGRSERC